MQDPQFSYTDKEFNDAYIAFLEECIQVMRERGAEYNADVESTSMHKYFGPDLIVGDDFTKVYVFIQQKFERMSSCLSKYMRKVKLEADTTDSYRKTADSLLDLVNYTVFEAVILKLHQQSLQDAKAAEAEEHNTPVL